MKVFATVVILASLAYLVLAQDEDSNCPEELKAAAHKLKSVCGPMMKYYMKQKYGEHGGPGCNKHAGGRKRRQEEENIDAKREECLNSLKEEEAFADLIADCSDDDEAEQFQCIVGKYFEACPHPGHKGGRRGPPPQ